MCRRRGEVLLDPSIGSVYYAFRCSQICEIHYQHWLHLPLDVALTQNYVQVLETNYTDTIRDLKDFMKKEETRNKKLYFEKVNDTVEKSDAFHEIEELMEQNSFLERFWILIRLDFQETRP